MKALGLVGLVISLGLVTWLVWSSAQRPEPTPLPAAVAETPVQSAPRTQRDIRQMGQAVEAQAQQATERRAQVDPDTARELGYTQ